MRIIKTLFITFLYILILSYCNINIIENVIVKYNISIVGHNMILLMIFFVVELGLFMFTIDAIMFLIEYILNIINITLNKKLIYKKFVYASFLMIRIYYFIDKIFFYVRPGIIIFSNYRYEKNTWNNVTRKSIEEKIINLFKFLTSCYFTIPIVSVLIVNGYLKINREILLNILKEFISVNINFSNLLSYLPTITALITIIPVIFFFYFYSEKSEARKVISESEKKYYKKVVKINEDLSNILWRVIYDLSKNLDYVIKNQDLVIELLVKESICNYDEVSDERFCKLDSVDEYPFAIIGDLQKVSELCIELCESKYKESLNKLYRNKYEFIIFKTHFYTLKNYDYLNEIFYTKQGMYLLLKNRSKYKIVKSKEEYKKLLQSEKDILLYDALELLYIMYRFAFKMTKFLHQTNNEYHIKKLFDKNSK